MRIGELARRTGLAQSRIRFYEGIGLLTAVERLPNGFRTYSEEAVVLLGIVTLAQKAGLSLDEIREMLPTHLDQWQHDQLLAILRGRVDKIDTMLRHLEQTRTQLTALITDIEARPDGIDCTANARRVLGNLGKPTPLPAAPDAEPEAPLAPLPSRETVTD